jgi:hypothetical protein
VGARRAGGRGWLPPPPWPCGVSWNIFLARTRGNAGSGVLPTAPGANGLVPAAACERDRHRRRTIGPTITQKKGRTSASCRASFCPQIERSLDRIRLRRLCQEPAGRDLFGPRWECHGDDVLADAAASAGSSGVAEQQTYRHHSRVPVHQGIDGDHDRTGSIPFTCHAPPPVRNPPGDRASDRDAAFGAEPRRPERRPVPSCTSARLARKRSAARRPPPAWSRRSSPCPAPTTSSRTCPHAPCLLIERLLRLEVVVQGQTDARLTCDVPHRRPRQALAGERGNGRGEDALPRAIAPSSDGPARASSAPAGGAHSTQRFIARTRDSATSR